ncbi:MAG: DUF1653 domain-containing protein [Lachnospiraceae bacterium]|nr:DUF1653 domain-containing protein [Lachnospiraceae bacterium]
MIPEINEIYRHFKGELYRVLHLAQHSESGEEMVVYRALYGDCRIYVRPLDSFTEILDKEKYPGAGQAHRFERVQELGEEVEETLDPALAEFLDAQTCRERINILNGLHHRITDAMITTMAVALDVEIPESETEKRFQELMTCLVMKERYEGSRG